MFDTRFIIFNTKFIIFNTKFIVFNTKFIIFNTKFTRIAVLLPAQPWSVHDIPEEMQRLQRRHDKASEADCTKWFGGRPTKPNTPEESGEKLSADAAERQGFARTMPLQRSFPLNWSTCSAPMMNFAINIMNFVSQMMIFRI